MKRYQVEMYQPPSFFYAAVLCKALEKIAAGAGRPDNTSMQRTDDNSVRSDGRR